MQMKVLVLGGYGNFGARICRALAGNPAIELQVGGRSQQRADAMAGEIGHGAQGLAIDHAQPDFSQHLIQWGVELLIHTAGPFQAQGYSVAHAAASAGAHYVDLADGRRFVCDFSAALDAVFRHAGRTAISGASTVPALSSAVVDHLCQGWEHIDSIDVCIAPAQTAPRGKATLAAVLSYCGAPIRTWMNGHWTSQRGWAQLHPVQFARLPPRLGALCDIPDLELFPAHYKATQRVMFRAALEVRLTQYAFAFLALLRKWGILASPERLAGLLSFAAPALDFLGSSLGGMVVRVEGINAHGARTRSAWHIAADHDHGPEIPCMAAILFARRMASNKNMKAGAFACVSLLDLAEFKPEFDRWGMVTDIECESTKVPP
jgi:saccharopine dehydrogenase-like NADP-dependent oxidoreductase